MWDLICLYWPVVPSIIAVASVIAKISGNETAIKGVYYFQRVIDALALTTGKTKLKSKISM